MSLPTENQILYIRKLYVKPTSFQNENLCCDVFSIINVIDPFHLLKLE